MKPTIPSRETILSVLSTLITILIALRWLLAGAAIGGGTTAAAFLGTGDSERFRPMAHAGLANEAPAGSAVARDPELRAAAIASSEQAAERTTSGPDDVGDPRSLAAPEQPGCKTDLVRNSSSRKGARPALLVAHYTVSENRSGWSDVDAIVSYFDQPRAQASSHYVIDFEGNCAYIVNEAAKSWTQGFFNPWSISIEFIATGKERVWDERALRRGAKVFAAAAERWGIPVQQAVTRGCEIVRAGITDHDALDCGNSHTDVKPYFPMSRFLRYVRDAATPPAAVFHVYGWRPGLEKPVHATTTKPGERVARFLRAERMTRVSVRPAG